jgi:hypothetical protein
LTQHESHLNQQENDLKDQQENNLRDQQENKLIS